MKQTVNEYDFRRAFETIRPDNFSYEGLGLLFEYFTEYEDSCGEELELDVIAICCEWAESDADTIAQDFSIETDGDEYTRSAQVLDYLNENTMVAGQTASGSIVYASF